MGSWKELLIPALLFMVFFALILRFDNPAMLFALEFLILVVVLAYAFVTYNTLVALKQNVSKAFANIDVLLKQRNDEIPRLVETVKGYMKYERNLLEKLAELREAYSFAKTVGEKADFNERVSAAIKNVLVRAEAYPQLKASERFRQLQTRISVIENQIADRREFYNESVKEYNIYIRSIPDVALAFVLGYGDEELFKATDEETPSPEISF